MPCRTLDSILEQENMSLLLGNQTVKGKGASCFVLLLHSSGRKKGGGEIWAKGLQGCFIPHLQLFCKSQVPSKCCFGNETENSTRAGQVVCARLSSPVLLVSTSTLSETISTSSPPFSFLIRFYKS